LAQFKLASIPFAIVCGGLLIRPISTGEVPDHTKITMFSEAVIPDTGETGTQIRYKVYGIRRGRTTEVK
jgi:hypothetical protein